eukprot:336078_1
MSRLAWFSIFCSSIIFICTANKEKKKCLSFSGGGIRAAMGAYDTMRGLAYHQQLDDIRCISLISGGAWGFAMWLYEDHSGRAKRNILRHLQTTEAQHWGPRGPGEEGFECLSPAWWWNNWSDGVQTNIIDMTSLKGSPMPKFKSDIRHQLNLRGLSKATLYWVVEKTKVTGGVHESLEDFCWFINEGDRTIFDKDRAIAHGKSIAAAGRHVHSKHRVVKTKERTHSAGLDHEHDYFQCSVEREPFLYIEVSRTTGDREGDAAVTLLDLLAYISSAWACYPGTPSTRPLVLKGAGIADATSAAAPERGDLRIRIRDAGATFNDPLIPYLTFPQKYSERVNPIEIWNFDFSESTFAEKGLLSSGSVIDTFTEVMKRVGRTVKLVAQPEMNPEYGGVSKYRIEMQGDEG